MIFNTAIFYDIENLVGVFSAKANTAVSLDEIHKKVLEQPGVTGISIQRAYADWATPSTRSLRHSVLQVGIEPVQVFNTNSYDKVKNAADVSLIIDAVDLVHRRPEIEIYVIASGDGIFAFLAKKLHEYGKRVIGCGFNSITNVIFENSCDYFIGLEKDEATVKATDGTGRKRTAKRTKPENQPNSFAKTKFTEALLAADIPIVKNLGDKEACITTVRRMMDALFSAESADKQELELSVFSTYMTHFLPGFKVTRHGHKRIRDYLTHALAGTRFCLYSLTDNVVLMGPRENATGKIYDDAKQPATTPQPAKPEQPAPAAEGPIRVWLKNKFKQLSAEDKLTTREIKKLTTAEYSLATFGVRTPIFKQIETRAGLDEQRKTSGGKVKYWKESFKFRGKTYLVYKEWVAALHQSRAQAWLDSLGK